MKGQKTLFSKQSDEWSTPADLFKKLDEEFHFQTDPCTTKDNPLGCKYFYTKDDDGLTREWIGPTFINPPYSQIDKWVAQSATRTRRHPIVMLIPARTDTRYFHQYVYKKPDVEIRFIKGRLKFGNSKNSAPFPSMIVIFR